MHTSQRNRTAIVVGAGTTGLLSAAALARHFSRVTVLERDRLPDSPAWRKGSPQSPHVHVLLQRGADVIDRYLPEALIAIDDGGGHRLDMSRDVAWFYAGGWKQRPTSGITMHSQTKGLLEFSIRRQLARIPQVAVRDDAPVQAFVANGRRISGVVLAGGERIDAELVVDAGGRHSRTPAMLQAIGFPEVNVSRVPVDVGYATALLELPHVQRPWQALLVHPRYPDARLGVLLPVEGENRWLATLVGWRGDHPPEDWHGFLGFARSLAVPDFYGALTGAQPLDRIWRYRYTGNQRRHFEALQPAPENLVVVGDAACSFNPIYAQGMSQGATAAAILDKVLDGFPGSLQGFARRFQKHYARFAARCWLMSTTEEYRDRSSVPDVPAWAPLANWYLDRVHAATWHDPAVALRFVEVMHMRRHPGGLATPGVAMRVLLNRAEAAAGTRAGVGREHVV